MQVVGFWKRFLAYIIDSCILFVAFFVISLFGMIPLIGVTTFAASEGIITLSAIVWYVVLLIAQVLYFVLLESSRLQGTIGKKALGIKVVDKFGERISFGKALTRYVSKFLSGIIFYIGYIMIGVTKEKQGLHDMIAKTYCVETERHKI